MTYNNYYPYNQNNAITWVSGETGAKAYLVAPNQSVVLWDSEDQVIYIKSADSAGMPTIKTLDYTVRDGQGSGQILDVSEFATKEDISLIKKELEALREDFKPRKTKVSER